MMRDLGTLVQTLEFEKIQGCGNSDLVGLEWSGLTPKSIRQKAGGAPGFQCSSRLNIYYK